MIDQIKNISKTRKDFKNFGLVIGTILIIIYFLTGYFDDSYMMNLLFIGLSFIVLGIIFPPLLKPIYIVWMAFALALGWIMTRIILSILFFVIISPLGIFARIVGKDFLNIRKTFVKSYWNIRDSNIENNQDLTKQH